MAKSRKYYLKRAQAESTKADKLLPRIMKARKALQLLEDKRREYHDRAGDFQDAANFYTA